MTPECEPVPLGAEHAPTVLTPGPRLGSLERLEIYRGAYHARLIECLLDDYPALAAALGESPFDALCRGYIGRHPSRQPSLNAFGRHMEAFCRAGAAETFARRAFAADLAALEWAIVEVIHAPSSEPLTLQALGDIPIEQWADASLEATSACRLLRFAYPVNAYFQAFRDGLDQAIPEPSPSAVAVYRSGPTIWRMDLGDAAFELLSALTSGLSLGASLEGAAASSSDLADGAAAERVTRWFQDWVASGLFSGVKLRKLR
jgi:hypothetical protein